MSDPVIGIIAAFVMRLYVIGLRHPTRTEWRAHGDYGLECYVDVTTCHMEGCRCGHPPAFKFPKAISRRRNKRRLDF